MRARLQKFLPLVLLALAMQVLAPIVACWAAGLAVADPLQNAVICHSTDASGAGAAGQTNLPATHAGSCSICCLAQANATLDSPQPTSANPLRRAEPVLWHEQAAPAVTSHGRSNARARAPPQLT
ncbi:DUF2946 domain-containing protein [Bradyrhizobium sp. CCGUVB1N3]|uniref:DUF2946 family protein n=1 Tax=Bradyrhizobium sp. CCGUVB1N3 TaxID=2949629 RepID=UPI0020B451B8|nr:DUF2946 family protein [Bradyrhizobium sp. CCGUVB1N3]MCP3470272.1 DUF2946 domain-containing protein [Bradyrhizobium sp. CCGUVB1N3]